MASEKKLGDFLKEVSNWDWEEYVRAEYDPKYTTNQSIIFALIRACSLRKMDAIKLAMNRIEGKLPTQVEIIYPKIYYRYPNAGLPDHVQGDASMLSKTREPIETALQVVEGEVIQPPDVVLDADEADLPSMGLRDTLRVMADYPRELPEQITDLALRVEQWVKHPKDNPRPDEVPKVKSVVAAHLLILAQNRNMDALFEVFDQLDGKLVEQIKVLGDDIFITIYSGTAPPGAVPGPDGVLQLEATDTQNQWASKLGKQD